MKIYIVFDIVKRCLSVICKTYSHCKLRNNGIGNKIALNEGKSAIFYFSIWRVFGSFSNRITRKVVMENLNCYFYHVENI